MNVLMEDERIGFLPLNLPLSERQIFKLHSEGLENHEIFDSLGLLFPNFIYFSNISFVIFKCIC